MQLVFTSVVMRPPLVAVVIITAAKEEVRSNGIKSEKPVQGWTDGLNKLRRQMFMSNVKPEGSAGSVHINKARCEEKGRRCQ